MALPDPKEVFQDKFDSLVEELAGQAQNEEVANAVRARASRPGALNDFISGKAYAAMGDAFADYADELRQRAKDAR
jgi:hypothetical protein